MIEESEAAMTACIHEMEPEPELRFRHRLAAACLPDNFRRLPGLICPITLLIERKGFFLFAPIECDRLSPIKVACGRKRAYGVRHTDCIRMARVV
jgi:hypothetical protein